MMKINVKGTIIPNDDQWIYDLFDIDAISPARVCHAPRERVSWNRRRSGGYQWQCVTLHVSVWVEIIRYWGYDIQGASHAPRERVSWNCQCRLLWRGLISSRSTWACELKCSLSQLAQRTVSHAPRERVSWNSAHNNSVESYKRHAPRERVSWNIYI